MTHHFFTLKNHDATDSQTTVQTMIELHHKQLKVTYQISGDLSHYHFPKPTKQHRADKLWLDTTFELFLAPEHSSAYWEVNISPSTQWNLYHFADYREGMKESNIFSAPDIKKERRHHEYVLSFESIIPKELVDQALLINLCVILLDRTGTQHFFSIKRREGSPDFHDRAYFVPLKS